MRTRSRAAETGRNTGAMGIDDMPTVAVAQVGPAALGAAGTAKGRRLVAAGPREAIAGVR